MKHVFRNSTETAHIWAQQSQEDGHSANMFFEGKSIFSYGHHFEIARFLTSEIVLFTVRDYSSTTNGHKWDVRRAIADKTLLYVREFPSDRGNKFDYDTNKTNLDYYLGEIGTFIDKATRARSNKETYLGNAGSILETMKQYAEAAKCNKQAAPYIATGIKLVETETMAPWQEFTAKQEKLQKQRDAIAAKKAAIQAVKNIELWRAGERVFLPHSLDCMLRISADKSKVETSWGAYVPVREAKILRKMILNNRPCHGFNIGNYEVLSYIDGVLKIGCHTIKQAEIDNIGILLDGITLENPNGKAA